MNTDRPIQFRAPRVEPSNVPLIGEEDGGLSLRQMFRSVKDRMTTDGFKFGGKTDGKYVPPSKMTCADCKWLKLSNIRSFRSWSSLRAITSSPITVVIVENCLSKKRPRRFRKARAQPALHLQHRAIRHTHTVNSKRFGGIWENGKIPERACWLN